MKKLTFLLVVIILITYSCSKNQNPSFDKIDTRRQKIKEKVKLHSAGLRYFYEIYSDNILKTKSQASSSGDLEPITTHELQENLSAYLNSVDIPITKDLAIFPEFHFENTNVISQSQYNFKFSDNFYKIGLSILNLGDDLETINSNYKSILNSAEFVNLSVIEQDILIGGAETYIDSYMYWENNQIQWDSINISYSSKAIFTKGGDSRGMKIAKEDARGAIAGGIGGAIGGAITGAMAGGVGAGPGAAIGFLGGLIGGGVSQSIYAALSHSIAIDTSLDMEREEVTEISSNVIVPGSWNKIALDTAVPVPTEIVFNNGNILISF